jgi:hypothetical protein
VDVAVTTVPLVAPSLHHRYPLSEIYLILSSSCLRSTRSHRYHPMLDAHGLGKADDLECQGPNHRLPLVESSTRLRPTTSLMTSMPSRWAPARSLSVLGFPPASSVAARKTMRSHRSPFRSDSWQCLVPFWPTSTADQRALARPFELAASHAPVAGLGRPSTMRPGSAQIWPVSVFLEESI